MVSEFRARRDLICAELAKIDRVSTFRPAGAFYVFPRFDVPLDDAALGELLLKEAKVAITPGSAFGAAGAGHERLSYAASRETITESVRRIGEVVGGL
jgi:aspartate/methionine/tyrosine aminotransferase